MIRAGWRIPTVWALLAFFFATPVSGSETEPPAAPPLPPAEAALTPEEAAEILRLKEMLELMELLQDLDVLTRSEEEQ